MTWPLPPIMCAKCDKVVDEVLIETCPAKGPLHVMITAWCHGDRDTMECNANDIAAPDLKSGTAFTTPRLAT